MRGIVIVGAAAVTVGAVALAPRARSETWEEWLTKVAWSSLVVPSGPLGWVSCRLMPRLQRGDVHGFDGGHPRAIPCAG